MNIVHVSASITNKSGGVGAVIYGITSRSGLYKSTSSIVTYDEETSDYGSYDFIDVHRCKIIGLHSLGYSPEMSKELYKLKNCDIIHSHGLWLRSGYYARQASLRRNIPLVISPHGMLEPYALDRSKLKKKIISLLFENNNLMAANCIHAASHQEAENFKKAGIRNNIAIIPFGVENQKFDVSDTTNMFDKYPILKNKKIIFFLSRIHPKKGLIYLIEAWEKLYERFPGWQIVIAGPDEDNHLSQILDLISNKQLGDKITYIGPVHGRQKYACYNMSSIFVLPTLSENYGFVVPEALSSECPVITTKGTPWKDLVEYNCGWWIDIGTNSLIKCLEKACSMSDDDLKNMGINGRKLVESNYSWESSVNKFNALYSWLVNDSQKPEFVI